MPPRIPSAESLWTQERRTALRERLDALCRDYDARTLSTDPLQFVHRYADPLDREAVGLIAASLAYGRVGQILKSVEAVLEPLGPSPSRAIAALGPGRSLRLFAHFRHRFNDGRDVACLLDLIGRMQRRDGSIGAFFARGDPGGATVEDALARFSERALALASGRFYRSRTLPPDAGVRFFFPSPRDGSAVKRLNLYLRWMVRRGDGLDTGTWTEISPARLLVPLDTHVARIARHLALTDCRQATWTAVREVTGRLAMLDPADPVRYDYALCRLGILERCPSRRDPALCRECPLRPVCRHWSSEERADDGAVRAGGSGAAGAARDRVHGGRSVRMTGRGRPIEDR